MNNGVKRFFAILALILIACTFISLIICLIKNSEPGVILAHLFCIMIVPCIFYIFDKFVKHRKSQ